MPSAHPAGAVCEAVCICRSGERLEPELKTWDPAGMGLDKVAYGGFIV